jgi:hypothetical protein
MVMYLDAICFNAVEVTLNKKSQGDVLFHYAWIKVGLEKIAADFAERSSIIYGYFVVENCG